MNTIERQERIFELREEAQAIVNIMRFFKGGSVATMQDTLNEIRVEIKDLEADDTIDLYIADIERSQLFD